jgi:hypothetical protein
MLLEEQLLDLLAAHADALNEGEDRADHLLAGSPELPSDIAALFLLALGLKRLLVPLAAPPVFRRRLHDDLTTCREVTLRTGSQRGPRFLWLGAAAAGSLLPVLGFLFLRRRRQREGELVTAT